MKVNELEKIKDLKRKLQNTKEQIKKYSYYDIDDIGEVIAKVMTAYEGIDYMAVRYWFNMNENDFYDYYTPSGYDKNSFQTVHVLPRAKESDEYARYRMKISKEVGNNKCYLPPAYYTPHKKCYYMMDFLNYLYTKKVENDIIDDKEFYLKVADEFIENTKEEIEERQNMIKIEYQKKLGPAPTKNELMWHGYWLNL